MLADLHFHKDNLDRNSETFSWIVSEFKRHQPKNVIILGDVVHTRGQVHLRTYHEITRLFSSIHDASWAPTIHILIGNHDMLDKHSRVVNSMEIFGVASSRIRVYSEIAQTTIDGISCVFVPFHENQTLIVDYLQTIPTAERENMVIFAHAALDGAIINGISDHSNNTCVNSGLSVHHLSGFRQAFLGHFHHHRSYGEKRNVTYVGSPAQFNFGDAGDLERGLVLYDPIKNYHALVASPYAEHFVRISWEDAQLLPEKPTNAAPNRYLNKSVAIRIPLSSVADGSWNVDREATIRKILRTNWAVARVEVQRQPAETALRIEDVQSSPTSEQQQQDWEYVLNAAEAFIRSEGSVDEKVREKRAEYIKKVVGEHHSQECITSAASLFTADILSLGMKNFMGVQESLTINFDKIEPGVWLIRGRNGTGKSTFLEAIAWCLYGETFRQCNAHEIVNLSAEKAKRECCVTVTFSNGSVVKRSRKAGKSQLSFIRPYSEDDLQERGVRSVGQSEIDAMLNIGWKRFARSVMLSSSTTLNFSTSKEPEKRAVIEHLLGFEVFASYAAIADADLKQTKSQILDLTLQIARVEEQMKSLDGHISSQNGALIALQLQQSSGRSDVQKLKDKLALLTSNLTLLKNSITERQQQRERAQNMLNTILERQEYVRSQFTAQLDEVDSIRCELDAEKQSYGEKSLVWIQSAESELCEVRIEANKTQNSIDDLFSAYMTRLSAMETEENELCDRVQVRRLVENKEVQVQNAVDKLTDLQTTLENLVEARATHTVSRIEQAAQETYNSLDSKNANGTLDADLERLKLGVICPLQKYIHETFGNELHDQLVSKIEQQQNAVLSRQVELGMLDWPTDPNVEELLQSARGRSRLFEDVDLENYEKWAALRDLKSVQERRIARCEEDLRKLYLAKSQYEGTASANRRYEEAQKSLAMWRKDVLCLQNDVDGIRATLTTDVDDGTLSTMMAQSDSLTIRIKEIEAVCAQIGKQIADVIADVDRTKEAKKETQTALDTLEIEMTLLDLNRAVVGFWKDKLRCTKANGFRAFCIDRKVHELNTEIDRNMHIIGDDGEGLFLDLGCKLTSSLALVEKDGAVPFKRRSDGQKKRSELALFFAIVKKAKEEGGFYPKFMFMDEIYDALDEKGQVAVHRWIEQNTSELRGEKTFVITHSPAVETTHRAKIRGVILADWTARGSSYEVENDARLSNDVFLRT